MSNCDISGCGRGQAAQYEVSLTLDTTDEPIETTVRLCEVCRAAYKMGANHE
jgi:hypothetical protein